MQWINQYLRYELATTTAAVLKREVDFRSWHVEPLLNQAADLFDRCLAEYTLERALEERFAHICLEYEELTRRRNLETKRIQTDAVHEQDVKILEVQQQELDELLNETPPKGAIIDKLDSALLLVGHGLTGADNNRAHRQKYDAYIQRQNARAEKRIRDLQSEWAEVDAVDQTTSFQDRQDLLSLRKEYIDMPDGPFNLLGLRDKVRERIANDFKQGAARIAVAAVGLNEIYGYTEPLPDLNVRDELPDTDALPLDRAVKWVRDAISWLIGCGQYDQAFTRCLSLRAMYSKEEWSDKADEFNQGAMFRFRVPAKLFEHHRYVRLRGLAAYVVGARAGHTPWRATVKIPGRARFVREGRPVEFDQAFPACHLGRVEQWGSAREPEVCGTVSLMNGSPIGVLGEEERMWEVTIHAPDHLDEEKLELEDFQMQIMMVGRPI
jgi:hypothetical protein